MSHEDAELARRQGLSFLQAEGLASLPVQLSGHDVTRRTRIELVWLLAKIDGGYDSQTLLPIWTDVFGLYHDEIPPNAQKRQAVLKSYIDDADGNQVLNLIQFLARSQLVGEAGYKFLIQLCEQELLPYRLIGHYDSHTGPPTLFPISSPEQAEAFQRDYSVLTASGNLGARTHLSAASAALSKGDFAGSLRESIHAVESTAKAVTGDPNADLNVALRKLESSKPLHPALRQALGKLYAWTSDEKGVRHALIDANANVTEAQALFMLSACAAFAAWLTRESASA